MLKSTKVQKGFSYTKKISNKFAILNARNVVKV